MKHNNSIDKRSCDPSQSSQKLPRTESKDRTGSRRQRRVEQAAKQLRLARTEASGFDAAALRALEGDCYQLLTGGFRRASELRDGVDRGEHIETDGGTDRCVSDTERDGCPCCGDTDAPRTSHYAPFCNLYHKEKYMDRIRRDNADTDRSEADR